MGGGFPPAGPPDHGMPRAMKPGLLPTPPQPPLTQLSILGDIPPQFHPQVPAQPMVPIPFPETTHEGAAPPFHLQEDPSQPFATITDPRTMRGKQLDYPPQHSNENMYPLLQQQQAPPPSTEPPPLFLSNPPPLFPQLTHASRSDPRAPSHVVTSHRVTQSNEQPFYQDGDQAVSLAVTGEASSRLSTTDEAHSKHAKYAHLKVKSRQGPSGGGPSSGSHSPDEVGSPVGVTAEHRAKPPPFQMPKSLHDPSILSKPLDPLSLFGSAGEEDGSLPFSSQSSSGDSQRYGEITMSNLPQESSRSDNTHPLNATSSTLAANEEDDLCGSAVYGSNVNDEKKKDDDATALPYYAMFDTGLGGDDLEIDSAFGELS